MRRFSLRIFLSILGGVTGFQCPLLFSQQSTTPGTPQSLSASAPTAAELNIAVIAGSNTVNIVKDEAASILTVEIRDAKNDPVPGAVVNFTSPDSGPSVLFPNGARAFSVVAEANGRATAQELEPVATGPFTLTVTAESEGRFATAQIPQTNYLTYADAERARREVTSLPASAPARHKLLSNKAIAGIVVGVAAATAAGVVVGLRGGSSNSSGLGAGTPTVGAPH
jgi:hypothetical protein